MPNSGRAELEEPDQQCIRVEGSDHKNESADNTCKDIIKKEGDCVKVLIGRNWRESSNGAKIEVVNPATQELIDKVPNVSLEDVDEAVTVAKEEQKKWEEVSIYRSEERRVRERV